MADDAGGSVPVHATHSSTPSPAVARTGEADLT
jgi:hypothetical protein